MSEDYLLRHHKEFLLECLEHQDENKHFSLNINFLELFENAPSLGSAFLIAPEKLFDEWNNALLKVQTTLVLEYDLKKNFVVKSHMHCRIYKLPRLPEIYRTVLPENEDENKFLEITGTVVRVTSVKMLEYQRQYICCKCKHIMYVKAEYELKNTITPPDKCTNPEDCNGRNMITNGELNSEYCKDYQEIKMQEKIANFEVGCMPSSMWVTLEDDLVDSCKPGDNITVCGMVKRRWGQFIAGKIVDFELVVRANHIEVNNSSSTSVKPELKDMFKCFWKTYADRPLVARDIIVKSICPQLFGLHIVKLAVAVVLAGGSHIQDQSNTGTNLRSEAHLLLVGDPGTGKSQLLKFAHKIIPRSVLTTGVGSTAAGLTVTAVMENGEWQLEGGALVLADGGICCIDEFNSMREHDRTSIHEAMEQQTISVAKASIVCKLSTRCSILAATNPKGNLDASQPLSMNIALPSPLLSRFDLILLIKDKINDEWDSLVADFVLNSTFESRWKLWTVDALQAYFSTIKKINPILTEDSNKILAAYYQSQRRKSCRNKSRTTVRLLDSLVRLSQGHARLMYHSEVQVVDAVMAVMLVDTSMDAGYSIFDLRFDVQADFSENPMADYKELCSIVLTALGLTDLIKSPSKLPDKPPVGENVSKIKAESEYFHVQSKLIDSKKIFGDISEAGPNKDTSGFISKAGPSTSRNDDNNSKNVNKLDSSDDESEGKTVKHKSVKAFKNEQKQVPMETEVDLTNRKDYVERRDKGKKRKKTQKRTKTKFKKQDMENVTDDEVMDDLQVLNLLKNSEEIFSLTDDSVFTDEGDTHDFVVKRKDNKIQACSTLIEEAKDKNETRNGRTKESNKTTDHESNSKKTKTKIWLDRFKFVPREIDKSIEFNVSEKLKSVSSGTTPVKDSTLTNLTIDISGDSEINTNFAFDMKKRNDRLHQRENDKENASANLRTTDTKHVVSKTTECREKNTDDFQSKSIFETQEEIDFDL